MAQQSVRDSLKTFTINVVQKAMKKGGIKKLLYGILLTLTKK